MAGYGEETLNLETQDRDCDPFGQNAHAEVRRAASEIMAGYGEETLNRLIAEFEEWHQLILDKKR